MPFQQVPNTASVELRFTHNGTPLENIIYVRKPTAYTESELADLAEAVEDWVIAELLPQLSGVLVYREVHVRGLNDATDFQATASGAAGAAGAAGAGLPSNVAKAIKLSSGMTGRNARGRIFMAGIPQGAQAGSNYLQQSFIDDLIEAIEALKIVIGGLGWLWVVVSRYKDGAKRTVAETFDITSVSVTNTTTDSMRGRLPSS